MQAERRLSQRLINYWRSLSELHKKPPTEVDVSPELLSDIWQHCFVIKQGVKGNPMGFRYCFMGKAITEECMKSFPHTRRFLEHVLQLHDSAAIEAEKAIETQAPVENNGSYHDKESQKTFLYRRCFVPLSDENGEINAVLGGFRWKITPYAEV